MRARLDARVEAGAGNRVGGSRGADVHEVDARAGLVGELEGALDGAQLDLWGTRLGPGKRVGTSGSPRRFAESVRGIGILGVQRQQQLELSAALHRVEQRERIERWVLRQAAVAQKGLDADHAALLQLSQAIDGLGDDATPARVVDERVDRKSTRLNSSHGSSSYAVFGLKK